MIKNGSIANADDVMNLSGVQFKNYAQLLYNSARIGFNPNLNVTTGVPNLKNIKYDSCLTNTAKYFSGMDYNETNDLYISQNNSIASDYYIDIETTTTNGISDLGINNCTTKMIKHTPSGYIYRMYCTSGTAAVKRAQIFKTLFYGTNGSDPRVSGITGLTALKTSNINDVGLKFQLTVWSCSVYRPGVDVGRGSRTATFSDTSTNTNVNSWSYCSGGGEASGLRYAWWYMPVGTVLNVAQSVVDETGTDTSAENKDNPQNAKIMVDITNGSGSFTGVVRVLIAWKVGAITWGDFTNESTGGGTASEVSYSTNIFNGITLSAIDYDKDDGTFVEFQTTGLPTVTDCIPTWNSLIDPDNTLTVSISADGTNYETVTDATIHRFTNTGTNLYIKFEIDRVDTAAVDKISEYAILYNSGAS